MSEVNETSPITIDATALAAETERLIQKAAQNNGLSADVIREQVQAEAVAQARKNLEQSAADASNPYKAMYEAERQQRETLEGTLKSIRTQGVKHSSTAGGPPVSAEQARTRAGAFQWNHKMTDAQKIAALGIPPESVSVKEAQKLFGRGADTKLVSDLHKSDPSRYRILREVAQALGVYGA
jgi:hypothetical protein